MVGDTEAFVVFRIGAWCRLLKVGGVLRADDPIRIDPWWSGSWRPG